MHRHHEFMLARLANNPTFRERIGVTPEQAQKIRTETFDFRKDQIRNRADLQVKMLQLGELLSAETPDRGAIDSKLAEVSAAKLTQAKVGCQLPSRYARCADTGSKAEAAANAEGVSSSIASDRVALATDLARSLVNKQIAAKQKSLRSAADAASGFFCDYQPGVARSEACDSGRIESLNLPPIATLSLPVGRFSAFSM